MKDVRISKLPKGMIIPLSYDFMFNAVFNKKENMYIIENLVSACLDIPLEEIKGHLELLPRNQSVNNKQDKSTQVDLLLDYKGEKINIELNNHNKIERNIVYACKVHGSQLKYKSKKLDDINKTIQINLNTNLRNKHALKERFYFKNETNEVLSEKLEIDMIDVEQGAKMCYNGSYERLAKWCKILLIDNNTDLENELGGIMEKDEAKEMRTEVERISEDDEYIELRTELSLNELILNQAVYDNKKEIAIKMIEDHVDPDTIVKYTSLTEDEVKELIKKHQKDE